ncbi:hypothetical protein BDR22DRAFT_891681 [Usnea florida]
MYTQTLIIAAFSMLNALALASPTMTNNKRADADDFVTCLGICSSDNTLCLNIAANNTAVVEGIIYNCELEAEYCKAVCGIDELALIIVQDGLAGLDQIEKDDGA